MNRILPRPWLALTGACLVAGLVALLLGLSDIGLPGSDDAIHGVAALRMAEAIRSLSWERFFDELVHPYKYPPLGRLGLALGFLLDGQGWNAPRAATSVCWIVTIALTGRLAQRAAVPGTGDAAAFWTVFFGLTCWLGVFVARAPLLEAWSTLVAVEGCLAYLRARERRSRAWAVATGVWIVVAILVKYSYGPLLLGTIGLSALIDVARPGPDRETLRLWPWAIGTVALGLGWWFVLPFPAGAAVGTAHRAMLVEFLEDPVGLSRLGPEYVIVVWVLMSCISLPAAALQLAGLVWGAGRWRQPAARVCATLTVAGVAVFTLFPYRIERCLLPSLFGGWVLGGCLCARVLEYVPRRGRAFAAAWSMVVILGTAGLGGMTLARLTQPGQWTADRLESVEDAVAGWGRIYAVRPAPDPPPTGTQVLLDRAVALLDGRPGFGWVASWFPYELIQWRLFQESGDWRALYPRVGNTSGDDRETEASFRRWAEGFPRILTFGPGDPGSGTSAPRLRSWMGRHPAFHPTAREFVTVAEKRDALTLFERSP